MAALMNTLFGEYLSVQQLFVILPYSPFPYLPTKVVKKMQTVYILSGKIGGGHRKLSTPYVISRNGSCRVVFAHLILFLFVYSENILNFATEIKWIAIMDIKKITH